MAPTPPALALGPVDWAVFAAYGAFLVATLAAVGLWVARDAAARGSSQPRTLGLFAAVLPPIGIPYYAYRRLHGADLGPRDAPPSDRDHFLLTWVVAGGAALLVGTRIGPTDVVAGPLYTLKTFVVILPFVYLAASWRRYRELTNWISG